MSYQPFNTELHPLHPTHKKKDFETQNPSFIKLKIGINLFEVGKTPVKLLNGYMSLCIEVFIRAKNPFQLSFCTVALHWNATQMKMFKVNERAEIKAVKFLKRNISTVSKTKSFY